MQQFDTPAAIQAVLDIPAGRIQFIAADRTDTTVEVRPANPAKSRDVKTAEQTEVTYTDGVLRIQAPEAKNRIPGVSASLDAGSGYGRINNSLKNSDGAPGLTIKATTSQGDINAHSL